MKMFGKILVGIVGASIAGIFGICISEDNLYSKKLTEYKQYLKENGFKTGIIKRYPPYASYGFIHSDGVDYYFSVKDFKEARMPKERDYIIFKTKENSEGVYATDISLDLSYCSRSYILDFNEKNEKN